MLSAAAAATKQRCTDQSSTAKPTNKLKQWWRLGNPQTFVRCTCFSSLLTVSHETTFSENCPERIGFSDTECHNEPKSNSSVHAAVYSMHRTNRILVKPRVNCWNCFDGTLGWHPASCFASSFVAGKREMVIFIYFSSFHLRTFDGRSVCGRNAELVDENRDVIVLNPQ